MAVGTKCRANSHTEIYSPYTASRVRFAGLQEPQPALDPVTGPCNKIGVAIMNVERVGSRMDNGGRTLEGTMRRPAME